MSSNESDPITVVLVDDHAMVRQALGAVLSADARFRVAGEAGDVDGALEVLREHRPDVVVLDYNLPGGGALEVLARVKQEELPTRVLVLTLHESTHFAVKVLEGGARGFVIKRDAVGELEQAILAVHQGEVFLSAAVSTQVLDHLRKPRRSRIGLEALSERELEMLCALGRGLGLKEAAQAMKVSVSTASTYRARIMKKLELNHTSELIRFALESGVVE